MAEVHVVGQILSASGFPKQGLLCKWSLHAGNNWKVISGETEGQTQVATPELGDTCCWSYPIDIHLATKGIQGWPKIHIQVYHFDWLGRTHIFGYGYITVPTVPGTRTLVCHAWRPIGSLRDRLKQYFLGGGPLLKNPDLVHSSVDRYKLSTETMGTVTFELGVILRNFDKFGVEYL